MALDAEGFPLAGHTPYGADVKAFIARRVRNALSATAGGYGSIVNPGALGPWWAALSQASTKPARVVGFGSSSMSGSNATTPENRWFNRLVREFQRAYPSGGPELDIMSFSAGVGAVGTLNIPGVQGFNGGLAATNSNTYLNTAMIGYIGTLNPTLILHLPDSNDAATGAYSPEETKQNLLAKINAISANRCHLLIHTYRRVEAGVSRELWDEYGRVKREIAREKTNVAFIDLSVEFETARGTTDIHDLIDTDTVHMTDAGHKFFANLMARQLGIEKAGPQGPAGAGFGLAPSIADGVSPDTLTETDVYVRTSSAGVTAAQGYPVDLWAGRIEVHRLQAGSGLIAQFAHSIYSANSAGVTYGTVYYRTRVAGVWQPWMKILTSKDWLSETIAAGTDLNTLTTPGRYRYSATGATTALNWPIAGFQGHIEVLNIPGASNVAIQRATLSTPQGGISAGTTFTRGFHGTTWGAWQQTPSTSAANIFTATQTFENTGVAMAIRNTGSPTDTGRYAVMVDQATGMLQFAPTTDAGTLAAAANRFFLRREGGFRTGNVDHLYGSGAPNGVRAAPVGSKYTDYAATAGAIEWVKTVGSGNTGWTVSVGDTGWRDLRAVEGILIGPEKWDLAGTTGPALKIRRIGARVEVQIRLKPSASLVGTPFGTFNLMNLPAGFIADGYTPVGSASVSSSRSGGILTTHGSQSVIAYLPDISTASTNWSAAAHTLAASASFISLSGWPTVLPGTAM